MYVDVWRKKEECIINEAIFCVVCECLGGLLQHTHTHMRLNVTWTGAFTDVCRVFSIYTNGVAIACGWCWGFMLYTYSIIRVHNVATFIRAMLRWRWWWLVYMFICIATIFECIKLDYTYERMWKIDILLPLGECCGWLGKEHRIKSLVLRRVQWICEYIMYVPT